MRDSMKIFVGNVDDRTTQEELSELFEKHGTVVSCAVMKQYAFVHMRGADRAAKAIEELNGRELHGKKMVVELSKPRPQNTWKIFVGNVGPGYDAAELRTLFEEYGKVIECDVVKDPPIPGLLLSSKMATLLLRLSDAHYASVVNRFLLPMDWPALLM